MEKEIRSLASVVMVFLLAGLITVFGPVGCEITGGGDNNTGADELNGDNDDSSSDCDDLDFDGHTDYNADLCPAGDDQCDDDPNNWTATGCSSCLDEDGDGYGTDCDNGTDCLDTDYTIWTGCFGCEDRDGDLHDAYDAIWCPTGDDNCDDVTSTNEFNWTVNGCSSCVDTDGDGYGTNCDLGDDCAINNPFYSTGCEGCTDGDYDGDGHDAYDATWCPTGDDNCDDMTGSHEFNWTPTGCASCTDNDSDGRGANCDLGGDCHDGDNSIWTDCPGCEDTDGDNHAVYNATLCPTGDDNCDDMTGSHEFNWTSTGCSSCIDNDNDGYGDYCDNGADCDDDDNTIHTGCFLVAIPAGCFDMGDAFGEGSSNELPVHNVCISAFFIDDHEVTNAEYKSCVLAGGCVAPNDTTKYNDASYANHPVGHVDWDRASTYCTWAGERLPTEAEWEYAARGGLSGNRFPWGDTIGCSDANYYSDSSSSYDRDKLNASCVGDSSEAGDYAANGYGLYDMAGNVWEWVNDRYDSAYYSSSPIDDPTGPTSGTFRVLRGGCWGAYSSSMRVSYRNSYISTIALDLIGFRCAASASE
jgi:formylglycine-generating enzyme required for sulfatase activity